MVENDFSQYLLNWKMSVIVTTDNCSQTENDKMFLSWQTYEGLQVAVHSIIEAVKYLLGIGM